MNHTREHYAALKAVARDTSVFTTPIDWISNGTRGHKHNAARGCRKMRKGTNRVTTQASPDDLMNSTVCSECFLPAVISHMPANASLSRIIQNVATITRQVRYIEQTRELSSYNHVIVTLREAISGLNIITSRDQEARDEYGTKLEEHIRTAHAAISAARAQMADGRGTLIKQAALGVMTPASYGSIGNLATTEQALLLGDVADSYGARNTRNLYNAWEEARKRESSDHDRAQRIASEANRIKLTSIAQLREVHVSPEQAADAANLEDLASTAWTHARDQVITDLVASWDSTYQDLCEDTTEVTLAFAAHGSRYSGHHNDLLTQVIEAHTIAEKGERDIIALQAPRVIAAYLHRHLGTDSGRHGVKRLHTWDGVDTLDVITTAVELWAPFDTDSPYREFSDAIASAQQLMHP